MTINTSERSGHDMVCIRAAARLAGCSLTRLCTMFCNGVMSHVGFEERLGFEGIKVSYLELRERIYGSYRGPLHVEDVAQLMEISLASARALMGDGTLPALLIEASVDKDAYLILPRDFATKFSVKNIATEKLAADAGMSRSRVVQVMLLRGVLPSVFNSKGQAVFFPRR